MNTTTPEVSTTTATKTAKPDFGSGRYSPEMERLWQDAQLLFRMSSAAAEKFARQAAKDAGEALALAKATIKVGKTNNDGKGTISDASKIKGVTYTNSLNLVRAIQWCGDAGKNGIVYGKTKWVLVDKLAEYVQYLEDSSK